MAGWLRMLSFQFLAHLSSMAGYDTAGIVLPIHLPLLATHPRAHAKVPVSLVAICANGSVKSGGHDGPHHTI